MVRGQTYLVLANEGDFREDNVDRSAAGSAPYSAAAPLDRLRISNRDSSPGNLYAAGARSLSIRDAEGTLVYDSGSILDTRGARARRLRRRPQPRQGRGAGGRRADGHRRTHLCVRRPRADDEQRDRHLRHHQSLRRRVPRHDRDAGRSCHPRAWRRSSSAATSTWRSPMKSRRPGRPRPTRRSTGWIASSTERRGSAGLPRRSAKRERVRGPAAP